jgi:hypothetical protein
MARAFRNFLREAMERKGASVVLLKFAGVADFTEA